MDIVSIEVISPALRLFASKEIGEKNVVFLV
jgi:hypothetical protein